MVRYDDDDDDGGDDDDDDDAVAVFDRTPRIALALLLRAVVVLGDDDAPAANASPTFAVPLTTNTSSTWKHNDNSPRAMVCERQMMVVPDANQNN